VADLAFDCGSRQNKNDSAKDNFELRRSILYYSHQRAGRHDGAMAVLQPVFFM
jgi:hypothetical protein